MSVIEIIGGKSLNGEIEIQGSKNAILPVMAASLLNRGVVKLNNCPKISDVFHTVKILEHMGCKIKWENRSLIIDTRPLTTYVVPDKYVREMRSSIILAGAMLGRTGCVTISYPGGCSIGTRPIDLHLKSLKKLNVDVLEENGLIFCKAAKIKGNDISLQFPSVGATENIILAAVLAEGDTRIIGAAKEPEIAVLCNVLNQMGAQINGIGTEQIYIHGVKELHDTEFTLNADRIVAGTYLAAVAGTGGNVKLKGVCCEELYAVTTLFKDMGNKVVCGDGYIYMESTGRAKAVDVIRTRPYPGFPTDMQSQIMSVLTCARGTSVIIEDIFEARYKIVGELAKMGAQIIVEGKVAVIKGVSNLSGADVASADLRGGAALVIAGLMAYGTTEIENTEYIMRGYENICGDLSELGADIKMIK